MARSGLRGRRKPSQGRLQVEALESRQLLATITVNTTADGSAGDTVLTLRQAIQISNAGASFDLSTLSTTQRALISGLLSDPNTIAFNIAGTGAQTIAPTTPLPAISAPVTIDGTTQLQTGGLPAIVLNGQSAGTSTDGLTVSASNTTIKALVVNQFGGNGIVLSGGSADTIQSTIIGSDPTGTLSLANGVDGIRITGASNASIGGTTTSLGNTIAFNLQQGVHVQSGSGNLITHNSIFKNVAGGILLDSGANANIATPTLTTVNTVSGVTTLRGTFVGTASTTYTLDIYTNTENSSQGRAFVESKTFTTDSSGNATLVIPTTSPIAINQYVTTTATDPSHNTSAFSTAVLNTVPSTDLALTGTATPEPVAQGGYLSYNYTITNNGPSPADVTFSDSVPTGLNLVTVQPSRGTVTTSGNAVTVTISQLQPGTSATISILTVPLSTISGTVTNTASITSAADTNTSNNTVTLNSTVKVGCDLVVEAQPLPDPVVLGQNLAFVYIVKNQGTAPATTVRLLDTLNPNLTFVSASTSQGTIIQPNGTSFVAAIGTLAAGASAQVILIAKPTTTGFVANGATAVSDPTTPDVNYANNVGGTGANVVTSLPSVTTDNTAPTVTSLQRFGIHREVTSLALTFSQPMLMNSVQDVANYQLDQIGLGGRKIRIALTSASYDVTRKAVILTTRRKLSPRITYQLTVNGSTASGVANLSGVLLNGSGTTGSNYVRTFRGYAAVTA